ncbi:MAG: hypothetical protein ACLKAK_08180 [Alkaliphilus sp.]
MKKKFSKTAITIALLLVVTVTLINDDTRSKFIVFTDATIEKEVFFELNYGQNHTNNHLVVMQIIASTIGNHETLRVQFSVDDVNWFGYNNDSGWLVDYAGVYQSFYSGFNIGTISGLKTVYVRILDKESNILAINSSQIYYLSDQIAPIIKEPVSNQFGSGTKNNPFFTATQRVLIDLNTVNGNEFAYTMDGVNWSKWHAVDNALINKQILLFDNDGIQAVHIKIRNQFNAESSPYILYFIIDKIPPKLEILDENSIFTTDDGSYSINLAVSDASSDIINYQIFVERGNTRESNEKQIDIIFADKIIYNEMKITNLSKGIYTIKVFAYDRAGNYTQVTRRINSI